MLKLKYKILYLIRSTNLYQTKMQKTAAAKSDVMKNHLAKNANVFWAAKAAFSLIVFEEVLFCCIGINSDSYG